MDYAAFPAEASGLLTFAAAYAAMLVTPGPSFAVVSEASLSGSRRDAMLVVIGIACGASLLIMLVLNGASSLPVYESTAQIGRYAGTVLFLIIGYRAFRRSWLPATAISAEFRKRSWGGSFVVGLVTALTNPISFAFFSSVALASQTSELFVLERVLPLGVFLMALCWFGFLATLLSLPAVKTVYGRASRRVDAAIGALLVVIALSWLLTGG